MPWDLSVWASWWGLLRLPRGALPESEVDQRQVLVFITMCMLLTAFEHTFS